jgi:hypothetical protein
MDIHTCWEQKAIFFITTPIQAVASILYLVLTPVYIVLAIPRFPLMALTLAMSVAWLPALGVILLCGKFSRSAPAFRPLSFALALPFLVFGHFLVSLEPVIHPDDTEGKMAKLLLIEHFPYGTIAGSDAEA